MRFEGRFMNKSSLFPIICSDLNYFKRPITLLILFLIAVPTISFAGKMPFPANENSKLGGTICVAGENNEDFFYYTFLSTDFVMKNGLIGEAIVGQFVEDPEGKDPSLLVDSFRPNPVFVQFFHEFIRTEGPKTSALMKEAIRQKEGWVYLIDGRVKDVNENIPPYNIIGGFKVEAGKPVEYKGNPNHALLTEEGFFQLGSEMQAALIQLVISKYK